MGSSQALRGRDVYFKLEGTSKNLAVGATEAGVRIGFSLGDVDLAISYEMTDNGEPPSSTIVASALRPAPADVIEALCERERDFDKPGWRGSIQALQWLIYPRHELVAYLAVVRAELTEAASRLATVLRWSLNRVGTSQPFVPSDLRWSFDGRTWHSTPPLLPDRTGFRDASDAVQIGPEEHPIVEAMLNTESFQEPLARQLLLEGGALAEENPRAAWVLAIASAEVGIKQFFAAQGYVEEGWVEKQSPPLTDLIRDHLPKVSPADKASSEGAFVPKAIRRVLHGGVEARNKIVHQGSNVPSRDEMVELLWAVNDFLYLLDWAAGEDWAWLHVRAGTRVAWG